MRLLEGRFFVPGMLMIGAAGRNAGKTELACHFIRESSAKVPVTGIKVTTVERTDGNCPRGGQGCGVCSSLTAPWCLTTEENVTSKKDTSRLLSSGAGRVYWLRVLKASLQEGASELLDVVGPGGVCVCESNSLRHVVEPGLFLLVRHTDNETFKPSARAVKDLADALVVSDGHSFSPSPHGIALLNGQWTMRRDATAIVLAGGDSKRMGRDKSMLLLDGIPLIQRVVDQLRPQFSQILVSTNAPETHGFLGLPMIPDRQTGQGPLMALASSLPHASHDWSFVVCCDTPDVPGGVINALFRRTGDADAVIPVDDTGRAHPLFALYHRRAAGIADAVLEDGRRAVLALADRCTVARVTLDGSWLPSNLNTPEDAQHWLEDHHMA
jgi:molybdopterin-guanine dinucleotide biosynthesis protein A